jgi:hypothetical protein
MEKIQRLRAMGSLCRQQAAYKPAHSWKLLAEAEFWEHMAEVEKSSLFEERTTHCSSLARVSPSSISNDAGWETTAAA